MGNLGDALNKAGLISDDELKRQKSRGSKGPRLDQLTTRHVDAKPASDADAARARSMVKERAVQGGLGGRRRWHYVLPDGKAPSLDVDERAAKKLESGQLAIATDGRRACLISDEAAQTIVAIDPSAVLFWNQ